MKMALKAYIEEKEKMSGKTAFQKIMDRNCVMVKLAAELQKEGKL